MIKRRRELLAVYVPTDSSLWRRAYPETFYPHDNLVTVQELEYIDNIYGIFMAIIDGYRKTLIEDEIKEKLKGKRTFMARQKSFSSPRKAEPTRPSLRIP